MGYYYYVCVCRCCKMRIYIKCSKIIYDHIQKSLVRCKLSTDPDLMFKTAAHECLGGIGILEVIQLIKSKEKLQ